MGAGIYEIRVCTNHQEKEQVPLIFSMAFAYSEYWCPACGHIYELHGAGDIVIKTLELEESAKIWKKKGRDYLSAISAKSCESMKFEGKQVTYDQLPEKEKKRLQEFEDNWEYKYKNNESK